VEYDISGCPDAKLLETLKKDWAWMVDDFGIRKDPAYAHEDGKPVVFIWGMGVPDRGITPETANAVVDFFKNDPRYGGNYVIGGVAWPWRKMDASWQDHFHHYDGILPWMSTSYARDVADFKNMGVDYYPHVWPGFSWANLKHLPTDSKEQFTPRAGGRFFEGLFSQAVQAGADRLFVGMFDEYDEGTAIIPMSDDPPPTPQRPGTTVKFFRTAGDEEHAIAASKPMVDFTFDGTAPAQGVSPENFFMKWEGQIVPPADSDYRLKVEGPAGDSCSIWIEGKQLLPTRKLDGTEEPAVTVTMRAGQLVTYRLDYTHATAPGAMRLLWESSPGLSSQEVPASAFVDAWGRFLNNEGNPPDFYLKLTAEAKAMLIGQHDPADSLIK
jgi:hypothetical protein